MKAVITFLIFFVLINSVKSQVAVLPTVDDIASYSNATTATIFVKDTIRGGSFFSTREVTQQMAE